MAALSRDRSCQERRICSSTIPLNSLLLSKLRRRACKNYSFSLQPMMMGQQQQGEAPRFQTGSPCVSIFSYHLRSFMVDDASNNLRCTWKNPTAIALYFQEAGTKRAAKKNTLYSYKVTKGASSISLCEAPFFILHIQTATIKIKKIKKRKSSLVVRRPHLLLTPFLWLVLMADIHARLGLLPKDIFQYIILPYLSPASCVSLAFVSQKLRTWVRVVIPHKRSQARLFFQSAM